MPPGYGLGYRRLPRLTPSIDPNVVPVIPAPDLVSCVHQSVPPARWCLGRGTSVVLARPSDLRADETPTVLVHPSFGVTDPLRRTGLEQVVDQERIIVWGAPVLPAQEVCHNIPWDLDCLVRYAAVIVVDALVLVNRKRSEERRVGKEWRTRCTR